MMDLAVYFMQEGSNSRTGTFVFVSNDWKTCDKLMILIHGAGVVRAGQWARRYVCLFADVLHLYVIDLCVVTCCPLPATCMGEEMINFEQQNLIQYTLYLYIYACKHCLPPPMSYLCS